MSDDSFGSVPPVYPELPNQDDDELSNLLEEINIVDREFIVARLRERKVDSSLLPLLRSCDINDLFPIEVGVRMRLRAVVERMQAEAASSVSAPNVSVATTDVAAKPATPTVTCSISTNNINQLPLEALLKRNRMGQDALNWAGKAISQTVRDSLIEQIGRYFQETGVTMTASHARFYSEEIVRVFPFEEKTYYCLGRSTPKGALRSKLYNKYRNLTQKAKRLKYDVDADPITPADVEEEDEKDELDCEEEKRLQDLLKRERNDWTLIMKSWKSTCSIRKIHYTRDPIQVIVSQWPLVNHTLAPKLLEIDFEFIHKNKSYCLQMKWSTFVPKIVKIYQQRIKDSDCKKKLNELLLIDQTDQTNKRDYLILYILHGLLKPSLMYKKYKPSISVSRDSQFYLMTEAVSIAQELETRREFALKHSLKVCPFVIIDNCNERYYVYLEEVYFTFDRILTAFDFCFKLFQIFNLSYPKESQQVWLFVQRYFYEIITKNDDSIENVIGLISDLNTM